MMKTTVGMLVDLLEEQGDVYLSPALRTQQLVGGVVAAEYASEETASDSWIHVVDVVELDMLAGKWPSALFICVADEYADELAAAWKSTKTLLLCTAHSSTEVVELVRSFIFRVDNLASKAAELLSKRESFDELLQLFGALMGNFISVSDSAFQLIDSTRGIEQDDPATAYLIEHGHHDPATVKTFMNLDLPSRWRDSSEALEVAFESPVCIYPTVGYVFRFRHNYFVHMVMLCNNRPVTRGLLDMFSLLAELMTPFVERNWLERKGFSQPHDRLVGELLNGVRISQEELKERADILHMPLEAQWRLAYIKLSKQDSVGIENLAWRLVACFGGSWITVYRGVVLLLSAGVEQSAQGVLEEKLRVVLAGEGSVSVGMSPVFLSLFGLREAYKQAEMAMLYGGMQRPSIGCALVSPQNDTQEIIFNSWREGFVNYLLYAPEKNPSFIDSCLKAHPLGRMCLDDLECATNQVSVVMTYLACNCKATPAAVALHMHRNNVLYHLGQIKQKYGIDLDDSETRFEIGLLSRFASVSNRKLHCIVGLSKGEEVENERC